MKNLTLEIASNISDYEVDVITYEAQRLKKVYPDNIVQKINISVELEEKLNFCFLQYTYVLQKEEKINEGVKEENTNVDDILASFTIKFAINFVINNDYFEEKFKTHKDKEQMANEFLEAIVWLTYPECKTHIDNMLSSIKIENTLKIGQVINLVNNNLPVQYKED